MLNWSQIYQVLPFILNLLELVWTKQKQSKKFYNNDNKKYNNDTYNYDSTDSNDEGNTNNNKIQIENFI